MELEMNVLYNVPHRLGLSHVIAIYFYMVGLHAGCSLLSMGATLTGKAEYKPLAKIGAIGVIILFTLGPLLLIIDAAQPLRFWFMMTRTNATSPLSWGVLFLSAYPVTTTIYIIMLFRNNIKWAKIWAAISLPLDFGVITYTGFILSMAASRAAWATALMPSYFLSTALVSGISLMTIIGVIRHWAKKAWNPDEKEKDFSTILWLTRLNLGFILLNLFFLFSQEISLRFESEAALEMSRLVLQGVLSPFYTWMNIGLGNVIPLLVFSIPKINKNLSFILIVSFFAMAGVYLMRYVVTVGGQFLPLI